jgi:hypothetical protein
MIHRWSLLLIASAVAACGGGSAGAGDSTRRVASTRSEQLAGASDHDRADAAAQCNADDPSREMTEFDTSGDDVPDVRKVFQRVGDPPMARLVLVCREADLNGDGRKDVVRFYSTEARPTREEADRNFDGRMDEVTYFDQGRIIRQELDGNGDGKVDSKMFYDNGRPVRSERDLAGRSTPDRWRPDQFEYFEEGFLVRVGTDLDGDGSVDRWDRDVEAQRRVEAIQAAREGPSDEGEPSIE